ncbi:hypothetical protein EOW77_0034945 [Bradyrhizobium yuanmingense]|uniref:hypothetical protein n=1 Tax=Bradyrhizobium yuanmingense TaxID=108015 RepID=UPI000FE318FB|nr:hypothetical protein [Bradyrhizobium yuanmingense]TGN73430.1 hypothetical protein EOW77_0034945 [Bradyrhizobium yuanmingense]
MTEALARRMSDDDRRKRRRKDHRGQLLRHRAHRPRRRDPERLDLLHRRDRVEQERPGAALYTSHRDLESSRMSRNRMKTGSTASDAVFWQISVN